MKWHNAKRIFNFTPNLIIFENNRFTIRHTRLFG